MYFFQEEKVSLKTPLLLAVPLTIPNYPEMYYFEGRMEHGLFQIDFAVNQKGRLRGNCWLVTGCKRSGLQPVLQPWGWAGTSNLQPP